MTVLAEYGQRENTRREHAALIRQHYQYREFAWPWTFRLTRLLYTRSWISNERPGLLFDLATGWLMQHRIILLAVFVAYYMLGIRRQMGMGVLLTHTENGFGSIANILLIIGAGGAFNAILKSSGLADSLAVILSNLDMHPILLAWLVALILHAAVGSATVAMMGATAIVAPMLPLYPGVSPEIIAIAIGSGAIGCTIVTDSLFWLVKQYCGASLSETFKYYTTATFIASLLALAATFLLSFII
nr:DUF4158 domain-containing protein [Klebsiella pneumoniae]